MKPTVTIWSNLAPVSPSISIDLEFFANPLYENVKNIFEEAPSKTGVATCIPEWWQPSQSVS